MKKIILLFLLIFSVTTQAQTYPVNPTKFGKISINTNVATASTTRINSQDPITNEINYIDAVNLPVPTSVINAIKQKADLSTGLLKNGLISINVNTTKFNISAGIGIISNFDDPQNPVSTIINFPAFTGITPTYLTSGNITYIAINSTPAIVMQATPFTDAQRRDLIILGAAIHSNLTNINVVNNISAPSNAIGNQLHDFMEAVGALNITGNKYTANGANLSLNKSAGTIFKFGVNFATNWKDPHVLSQSSGTALTFRYRTQNGTEGADITVINPAVYDLNNVLTSVPNNKFTIQTVTMFQTGLTRIQYGQAVYDDLASAQAAIFTRDYNVEANIKKNGITRAYIIVKNNTTSLQNATDSRIIEAQKFGGVASGGVALTFANIVSSLGYTPANDLDVVHKNGNISETITGQKTFTAQTNFDYPVFFPANVISASSTKPMLGGILGDLFLYSARTGADQVGVRLKTNTLTGTRTHTAPNKDGTYALISQTITNGVVENSPSEDAVFDALVLKSNDSDVVHKIGNISESINGIKSISNSVAPATSSFVFSNSSTGSSSNSVNAPFQIINSNSSLGGHIFNSGSGIGLYGWNTSSGTLNYWDSSTASTGDLLTISKNFVTTSKIDSNGNFRINRLMSLNSSTYLDGGGAAGWLTANGTSIYGGGLISAVSGVAKAYFYYESNYALVSGAAGVGVKIMANSADAVTVETTGVVKINNLAGSGDAEVVTDLNGNLKRGNAIVSGIKKYKAVLSQSGTNAPTAVVLENSLGGSVVWGYSSVGNYTATLSGAFTNNKTFVMVSTGGSIGNTFLRGYATSTSVVSVNTSNTSGYIDGAMAPSFINIEVYP